VPLPLIDPLSNKPAVLLVTVWAIPSLFVHLTVVFTDTVIVEGVNEELIIQTSFTGTFGFSSDFLHRLKEIKTVHSIIKLNNKRLER
jgi:hypothetical protein